MAKLCRRFTESSSCEKAKNGIKRMTQMDLIRNKDFKLQLIIRRDTRYESYMRLSAQYVNCRTEKNQYNGNQCLKTEIVDDEKGGYPSWKCK